MSLEKKPAQNPVKPAASTAPVRTGIRLHPSSTDYATFARTTARALGKSEPTAFELKPDKLLLSLMNLGS